jgi:nucleoside-diphosphate-sugar epimerase
MLELAKELEKVVGHELEIEFLPLPSDDPKRRKPDITKAQSLLKWEPTISLSQGLIPTYQYFQNWFRENES